METATSFGFVSIPVATLVPQSLVGVALYVRGVKTDRPRLYREGHYPLEASDLDELSRRGVKRLFVLAGDHERYQAYLRQQLATITGDEALSPERRATVLNEVARAVLNDAFRRNQTQEIIGHAETIGRHAASLLTREQVVASNLMRVLSHDSYLFTHSVNVSYYSVLLARALGIRDDDDLERIATGALLHDVGKLQVPASVLTKPTRLSREEFAIVRRHPTDGFAALAQRENLSLGQLMMVYQHHERLDGSGYPVGVIEDEIHPWARLCAVADVFEALTSSRAYRRALSMEEALVIMNRSAEHRLDKEMYECWIATISENSMTV